MSSDPIIVIMDPGELVACRICLVGEGNLYDIDEWGLDQAFIKLMGIPLTARLPHYLCSWCRALLTKAWRLRVRCHRADALLRDMFSNKSVTNSDIRAVDRSANKLTHTLTQNLFTDAQYCCTHTEINESDQSPPRFDVKKPCTSDQPSFIIGDESDELCNSDQPCIIIGDESDEQLCNSDQPRIIIDGESPKRPRIIIGDKSDKQPVKSHQPRIFIDGDSPKRPLNIIGDKRDKQPLKSHQPRIIIDGESPKRPRIIIGDKSDKQPVKSHQPRIIIDGESPKRPRIIIGDKSDKQPVKSHQSRIFINGESPKRPLIIIGDKSDKQPRIFINGESPKRPLIIIGDKSDKQTLKSHQPRIFINGESPKRPRILIEKKSDKQPLKSHQPRNFMDGDCPKRPRIIIGDKSDKQPRIFIDGESAKRPLIIIGDKSNKKPFKSQQPRIFIDGKSAKRPRIIIGDKSDKKPLKSNQPRIIIGNENDNQCDSDQSCIIIDDESEHEEKVLKTDELTYYVIEGDEIETAVKIKASDIIGDVADHINDSDVETEMITPVTQAIEYDTDNEGNSASAEVEVVKKTDIHMIPTVEECEEFAKKYNFKMQCLTDKEMVEEMELRKASDRYKQRKYKCNLCYRGFMTSTTFDNHTKKYHNPLRSDNECELCRVSYRGDFRLRQHVRNSHELRFTCAECGYSVWDKNECIAHASRHDLRQCKFCEKRFRNGSAFSWHMRAAHFAEYAASGSCEICGEIFTGEKGLRCHKLLTHIKVDQASPDLQCKRCRVLFDNEDALRKHSEQNKGKCDYGMSACTACGVDCADADVLLGHMRDAHQQLVHTCDQCNRLFVTESSLATHVDRVHRGIPPQQPAIVNWQKYSKGKKAVLKRDHMCELCGRVFKCNALLKTHQMSHTGERPFKCSLCPKTFVSAPILRDHQNRHAGIKKYRCKECPKTYFRQASIYKHRMVHTGERPFVCHVCNKTFNQSGSLVAHIKYVHMKVKPPPRRRRGLAEAQTRPRRGVDAASPRRRRGLTEAS